jgi:ElaB/YqjD/DUF883 family membrane-anchored ribosome-binding protein
MPESTSSILEPERSKRVLSRPARARPALARWRNRAEDFVRERPVVALLIAGVAGLVVGRLLRRALKRQQPARAARRRGWFAEQ